MPYGTEQRRAGGNVIEVGGLAKRFGSVTAVESVTFGVEPGELFGEIAALTQIVRPHVALITAIAPAHLGFFPSLEAIAEAKKYMGTAYKWGGSTPDSGFDCSGLVKRVFALEGVDLPRDTDQQSTAGRAEPAGRVEEIPAGALLFFGEGGRVTHVAIACGAGRFIHSYGDVRLNSLRGDDPLYDERLSRVFLFARDVLER